MATIYPFICQDCNLKGEVSGGPGALRAGPTQTYYCPKKRKLFDELVFVPLTIEQHKVKEQWIPWLRGEPCPKCGGKLDIDPDNTVGIDID